MITGYRIPESSKDTTEKILSQFVSEFPDKEIRILDIGCSYGVNASILKYGLCLDELYDRHVDQCDRKVLINRDREFYISQDKQPKFKFVGFDSSAHAVKYATDCGIIESGWSEDYESSVENIHTARSPVKSLESIDLVLSTGCVGYVTERTFNVLLTIMRHSLPLVFISYVLRMFDYSAIAETLFRRGYTTARLPDHHFKQRRCINSEEHDFLLSQIRKQGLNPMKSEIDGYLCADLYVSWRKETPPQIIEWINRSIRCGA